MTILDFLNPQKNAEAIMGGLTRIAQILLGILILLIGIAFIIAASKNTGKIVDIVKNAVPAGRVASVVEGVAS